MEHITYQSTKLQLTAVATMHEDGWRLVLQKDRKNAKEHVIATGLTADECVELLKLIRHIESPYIHDAVDAMKKNVERIYKVRDGMGHIFVQIEPEIDQD